MNRFLDLLKKDAETQTAKGILNAVYTMIKANKESNKFKYLNSINKGIAAATGGNILVLKIQSAKKLLPLNLKNVKPNAVGKEKTRETIVEPIVTIIEFNKYL